MGQIFNILAEKHFLKEVAEIARSSGSPTIILPTKRAASHMRGIYEGKIEALAELPAKNIPDVIPEVKRIFELAKIINKSSMNYDMAQSMDVARGVAALIDEMQVKSVSLDRFENIVADEFAEHWQRCFGFLKEVLEQWQAYLTKQNLIEPKQRQNLVLRQYAENIGDKSYLIAGSTGTVPATLELIKAIYNSPNGIVVTQGLATEDLKNLPENHAQFNLMRLVHALGANIDGKLETPRSKLITTALYPPEKFAEVKDFNLPSDGISLIECNNENEEANVIVEILKETKGSAILVTNSNSLARRVSAKLPGVNDSIGQSLLNLPAANFMLLLTKAESVVGIFAALKHKLTKPEIKAKVKQLELQIRNDEKPELDFPKLNLSGSRRISAIIAEHIKLAESLSDNLWNDSEKLKEMLDKIAQNDSEIEAEHYPDLLKNFLASERWYYEKGQGEIHILTPIEARLLDADVIIMAKMNEGCFPQMPEPDAFLNSQMRRELGMDLPDHSIGQQAHDFEILSHNKRVIYTRSLKDGGSPTTASRFIQALSTITTLDKGEKYLAAARKANEVDKITPALRPMPTPPKEARPKKYSATKISKLMRDPYMIYAEMILKLKKLNELEEEPGAKDFGNFVHEAIENYTKNYDGNLETLIEYGRERESHKFWWPRYQRIAAWFYEQDQERRKFAKVKSEEWGRMQLGEFEITAKADRLETNGSVKVIDYKTGNPSSQKDVNLGIDPQLPIEALIFGASEMEYWKMQGRNENEIKQISADLGEVKLKLEQLLNKFADENTPYTAQPRPKYAPEYNDYEHLERLGEWE